MFLPPPKFGICSVISGTVTCSKMVSVANVGSNFVSAIDTGSKKEVAP
jgi:hypothetical protein